MLKNQSSFSDVALFVPSPLLITIFCFTERRKRGNVNKYLLIKDHAVDNKKILSRDHKIDNSPLKLTVNAIVTAEVFGKNNSALNIALQNHKEIHQITETT